MLSRGVDNLSLCDAESLGGACPFAGWFASLYRLGGLFIRRVWVAYLKSLFGTESGLHFVLEASLFFLHC